MKLWSAMYHRRDLSVRCRFFYECKMGYEYHRQSHGTRVLSPRRKNPEEKGESEEARRGRERGRRVVWRCRRGVYPGGGSSGKVGERRVKAAALQAPPSSVPQQPPLVSTVPRVSRPSPSPRRTTPASRYRDQPGPGEVGRGRPCLCCSDGR
ncbi:unnamed protein product [Lasius platythorax]|uniref:Uncharacterized protein n=1 Tax=Lasius platythorax TaxID=488582 RepID=A0AAV2P231_9HYME